MHPDWKAESEHLEEILAFISAQLKKKLAEKEYLIHQQADINRNMWEDSGAMLDLESISDFMQHIGLLKQNMAWSKQTMKDIVRLDRQFSSPYFGRIDFAESGSEPEPIYIGITSLTDEDTMKILIYDWRAPVCSMFYDYETGPASYLCPAGRISGEITLKRQYKIEGGRLIYFFDSSLAIGDEILQEMLASNAGTKLKNIVSTIQKEQNTAIRNETSRVLAIQGAAGSGKTSVAMHRAAYLLYRHKKHIKAENLVILSSTDILGDYLSDVLPELGEDEIKGVTFHAIVRKYMPLGYQRMQTHPQLLEQVLKIANTNYGRKMREAIRFKSSMTFVKIMDRLAQFAVDHLFPFEDIRFRGQTFLTGEELSRLFHHDFAGMPPAARLKRMENRVSDLFRALKKKHQRQKAEELQDEDSHLNSREARALSRVKLGQEIGPLQEQLNRMFSVNTLSLYRKLFEEDEVWNACTDALETPGSAIVHAVRSYTLENLDAGLLGFEDAGPVLYLSLLLGETAPDTSVKHLIVDEAQDYSPLQFKALARLFPSAGITILGDINQNISPYASGGDLEAIARLISPDDYEYMRLSKSYRSTVEINRFSAGFAGMAEGECFGRHGEKPELILCGDFQGLCRALKETLNALNEKKYKTVALITRTQADAAMLYDALSGHLEKSPVPFRLMDEDYEYGLEGVMVMPGYLAKGLEFDAAMVVFLRADDYTDPHENGLLYTAMTRPLHRLSVFCPFDSLPDALHKVSPDLYTLRHS
ncbi:MAG TPA: AAA family ATPase [Thermoclostridium caenicola]|uniref:HelD family protein n=1 Tax=Thermoclostridium caenicola TaxID=659425 RepID=UPI002CA28DDD|nr:UvrD-helicase domain-containing protein [Thermoclostridium caenicola]HOK42925.1 AAA family ATPase [Thermoclostridium caenicola]HOL84334.1 AAA family ATPase [Thermoclostridium caenicola]HPO76215.1 AAA family ATPase [Thermoclostridium caenicola]